PARSSALSRLKAGTVRWAPRLTWSRMQQSTIRAAAQLVIAATSVCVLVGCGGDRGAPQKSSADSAGTSQPQTVSVTLPPAAQRPSVRRHKTGPLLRELSVWETNSEAAVVAGSQVATPEPSPLPSMSQRTLSGSAQELLARLART